MRRDRTPTPPDITPGIIARGHARPAPGVSHTVRTPLRVRPGLERRGDLHHFVVFPPTHSRRVAITTAARRRRSTAYIWHDSAHTYMQSFFPDARVTPLPRGFRFLRYVGMWVTQYSKPRVKITVNPGHWRLRL